MHVFSWHESLDSNMRHLLHGLKFEPVTEPGLKLSLFVKCIESEFTDSTKYFQNLRQRLLSLTRGLSLFMKPAPGISRTGICEDITYYRSRKDLFLSLTRLHYYTWL